MKLSFSGCAKCIFLVSSFLFFTDVTTCKAELLIIKLLPFKIVILFILLMLLLQYCEPRIWCELQTGDAEVIPVFEDFFSDWFC